MSHPSGRSWSWIPPFAACLVALAGSGRFCRGQEAGVDGDAVRQYESRIQPLLVKYCHECHSAEHAEGDIDLSKFRTHADLAAQIGVWEKVRRMLDDGQMPPPEAPQPDAPERQRMKIWVREFLARIARAEAGDPGPVILRRLTNAEYNYTVRDLTGVASLDPTREFPVDGAAGEGFTNVGAGQGMSPSLVHKYLDAAKEVARHMVLLPEGVRFSSATTQRDQTDELLGQIQRFYRRYTADGGGTTVNLDGNPFTTNQGGRLPVEAYLRATLAEREALRRGEVTIAEVAENRRLSEKYLRTLWDVFSGKPESPGPLIDEFRQAWRDADVEDAGRIAAGIEQWQSATWKYNSIGHIGREGGPTSWMEPVSPLVSRHEVRVALPEPAAGDDVTVYLAASKFAGGDGQGLVIWRQPRLEFPADESGARHPAVLLREVRQLVPRIEQTLARELPRTAEYLTALSDLQLSHDALRQTAAERGLDIELLSRWADVTGLAISGKRQVTGHFPQKLVRAHGSEAINGWGSPGLPSLLTNRSSEPVEIQTLTVPPHGVTLHPSPTHDAAVTWQSPIDAELVVRGLVADADNKCGNGIAWQLEVQSTTGKRILLTGNFDDSGSDVWQLERPLKVTTGDLVTLAISPRDGNHACDTTHVELKLTERGGMQQIWDLSADIVDDVLEGNPHRDRYGHNSVWHFCSRPASEGRPTSVVAESSLAAWRAAHDEAQPADVLGKLADAVQRTLTGSADALSDPDRRQRQRLLGWTGPLGWLSLGRIDASEATSDYGLAPERFGRVAGSLDEVDASDLCLQSSEIVEVRLPVELARGAELVTAGELDSSSAGETSVQLQVHPSRPQQRRLMSSQPVLVQEGTPAARQARAGLDEFRQLFPPTLCYARIVPVDEVVTLTLYHREDDQLKRLMLDQSESAELDRLWEELRYVSQEPLKLVVAFEQISEFATQDRPDLVEAFAPLRQPILDRAEVFRQQMKEAEPSHVEALIELAGRAWRRPLTAAQQQELRDFYRELRASEIVHEDALRLMLARILTAPAFLYKLENPGPGTEAAPVSDLELATRLSYFLWSSLPDAELRQIAESGQLGTDDELANQARRMLRDPRTRRLAIHFACQWLHVRDFDQLVEKNEQLYPEFAALRTEMNEETVLFFEDLFRNDGSILDLLGADHTFLTPALARHYGIETATAKGWQRIDGLRGGGRGGILGMASVLASQSGASRTSPILRGTWVSETLLGERLPRPPAGVPQLPEAVPQNLTARQLIEQHSSAPECATCHRRIDPYGFALEQFDTLGRTRPEPADTRTRLIDGTQIDGLEGLRQYLLHQRRDDVVRQFCRKLLGYALGREVQLSDEPLLEEIHGKLDLSGYRFSIAVEAIVSSRQFRDIRGQDRRASADSP